MQAIHVGRPTNKRLVIMVLFALIASLLVGGLGAKPAFADAESGVYGTVQINAGDWMTANGGGVTVYSNGDSGYVSGDYSAPAVGMKWQCVELAQRLYQAKGWDS